MGLGVATSGGVETAGGGGGGGGGGEELGAEPLVLPLVLPVKDTLSRSEEMEDGREMREELRRIAFPTRAVHRGWEWGYSLQVVRRREC